MLAFATRKQVKRSQSTRKLYGGKYVGQGTYGCGFSPALRCEGETVRKLGLFTKLVEKDEAEKEQAKRSLLQPVDPDMKYILYPVEICKVNKRVLGPTNPENNVESCTLGTYPRDLASARAVQYVDGGIDLEKLVVSPTIILPIFQSLPNLLLGLYKIHKAGLSHNDIKPANLVVKEQGDGSYITRFIDIGFVHTMNQGIKRGDELPFDANYYPWPYEMRFSLVPIQKPTQKSVNDWYTAYSYTMFKYLPYEHLYSSDGSKKFTLETATTLYQSFLTKAESLVPAVGLPNTIKKEKGEKENEKERQQSLEKKISELVLQKVDTYSLGNVLLYLYNLFLCHRLYKGRIEFYIARTKAYHDVDSLETQGLPESVRKWHQSVASEISKPYIELCLEMMSLDPTKRRLLPIVLVSYKKILTKMNTVFTKEQLQHNVFMWK